MRRLRGQLIAQAADTLQQPGEGRPGLVPRRAGKQEPAAPDSAPDGMLAPVGPAATAGQFGERAGAGRASSTSTRTSLPGCVPSTVGSMAPVGMRIKAARICAGLCQSELSARCDMSRAQISRLKCGQKIPGEPDVRLIARALDMAPAVIAHGTRGVVPNAGLTAGESEDVVRRRALLAAGISTGSTAALSTPAAAAPSAWDRALCTAASSPLPMTQLNAGHGRVAHDLAAARYERRRRHSPA